MSLIQETIALAVDYRLASEKFSEQERAVRSVDSRHAGDGPAGTNDDFFPGGKERTQDPILAIQGHVSYTFKPRLWLAVDSTWYSGGKSRVDDGDPTAAVANSRLGATLSIPASRRQSFKIAYSNGVSVRTGTDFSTIAVGWQFLHFRK